MTTQAIDVVTMFRALYQLEETFLGRNRRWGITNADQISLFGLYRKYKFLLEKLKGLKAKASVDWEELNQFLVDNGFDPMFAGPLNGIGAVSILDMLVEWLEVATSCQIHGSDRQNHNGFDIPITGRTIYQNKFVESPLVELKTKSGDSLWLMMPEIKPETPMDLARLVFGVMEQDYQESEQRFTTVQVPEISLDLKPDISFLCGATTTDIQGEDWFISQAKQQFKLRVSREGARVQMATGIAMRKGLSLADEPRPLVFNRPFVGWFTQEGARELPIGIFYADYDSWEDGVMSHS